MHTKSGILFLTKTERKALESLLWHARKDYEYHEGGSYGDGEKITDTKDYKNAPVAFEVLEFILDITK